MKELCEYSLALFKKSPYEVRWYTKGGKKLGIRPKRREKEGSRERESIRGKNALEQRTEGERGWETSRETENKNQKGGWGRGRNVLMLRFFSELPKLIISRGLAELCQEQEPTAKPWPGQALPATIVTPPTHTHTPSLNPWPAAQL